MPRAGRTLLRYFRPVACVRISIQNYKRELVISSTLLNSREKRLRPSAWWVECQPGIGQADWVGQKPDRNPDCRLRLASAIEQTFVGLCEILCLLFQARPRAGTSCCRISLS